MIVTLKDISEKLNVFISRVSRVVNKKYISPEIRKRVTEAFKKYNHTPN